MSGFFLEGRAFFKKPQTRRLSTSGSNSTATRGPSVELITFVALSWGATVLFMIAFALLWRLGYGSKDNCNLKRFFAAVIGLEVIAAVAATVLLIVRSLLSTQNGDSTALSSEGIAGRLWLILTEVIALLVWASTVAACAYSSCSDNGGKCGGACITVYGSVFGTLFLIGVALLGWSSFEFDTIQGNGSHSTVTPGLRTAAVVLSSVGVSLPFLALVILACIFCYRKYNDGCISDAKDWLEERRQKTKVLSNCTYDDVRLVDEEASHEEK